MPKSGLNRRAIAGKKATDERRRRKGEGGGGAENKEGGRIKWRPIDRAKQWLPAGVEAGEYWPELVGFEEGHAHVCTFFSHLSI